MYIVFVFKVVSYTRQEAIKSKGKRGGYSKPLVESTAWLSFVKLPQNRSHHGYHPYIPNLVDIWLESWDFDETLSGGIIYELFLKLIIIDHLIIKREDTNCVKLFKIKGIKVQ